MLLPFSEEDGRGSPVLILFCLCCEKSRISEESSLDSSVIRILVRRLCHPAQQPVLSFALSACSLAVWSSLATVLVGITVFGLISFAHKKLFYRLETMI